jgi:type VI secretion system protein ImpH
VPAWIQEFVGHWMALAERERTYLGREGSRLGSGAVLGVQVWDRQHKFRVHLGPLTLAAYESFLPGGARLRQLVDWVRFYGGLELEWDVRLWLEENEVPPLRLGRHCRLGWTTWLGHRRSGGSAHDLCLTAEAFVDPPRVAAA